MNGYRRFLPCVLVFTFGVAVGHPQPDPAADAERLAKLLASDKVAEREAAYQALDALGAAALPALRRADPSPDTEMRRRVNELITKLERQANAVANLAPTKVHLKANGTPLGEVLRDLIRQSRVPLHLAREPIDLAERAVTLDTGETSFWEAIDALCRAAKLSLRPDAFDPTAALDRAKQVSAGATLVLQDGVLSPCPTAYLGAVRVRLLPLHWGNEGLAADAEHRWCLEVLSEPRLRWQGPPVAQFAAVAGLTVIAGPQEGDPVSTNLIVSSAPNVPRLATRSELPLYVKFNRQAGPPTVELQGMLAGNVQIETRQTLTVADVQKAGGLAGAVAPDGTKAIVRECIVDAAGAVQLNVDVERPEGAGAGRNTAHGFAGAGGVASGNDTIASLAAFGREGEALRLFDTQDRPYTGTLRVNSISRRDGATSVTYTLDVRRPGAQPRKLELEVPGRALVEAKFTLRDVPRP